MPDLERVQQNTPLTLSQQWYESGAVVDPGTVTLGITRADGTSLVAAGTATSGSGTNPRTFNLTTTHTALLDALKVTWTSTLKGTLVSYVEVVGGFLCDLADLRAIFTDTAAYPVAKLADIRTAAEVRLEKACGRAFVPRYKLETKSVSGGWIRTRPDLRTVRSLTVNGTAWAPADVANLIAEPAGLVYLCGGYYSSWHRSLQATIGYEYGSDFPDPDITDAVLLAAQENADMGVPSGVRSQSADNMTVTYDTRGPGDSFAGSRLNSIVSANRAIAVA